MKKRTLFLISAMILSILPVRADEGMWLLPLIEKLNGKALTEKGFTITPDEIYSLNHSSIKDAIVQFGGGCTAEIVSRNGLLFTNHHCGYGSIQALSSVEHNYLKDGFWAMSRKEELPAAGLSVSFLESFTDVTEGALARTVGITTAAARDSVLKVYKEELQKEAGCDGHFIVGDLDSFYGGNNYYFIVYKVYRDVRFVGAPPSSIGKFGADTDNWMWPRHTCDFSVFRVYAAKDNAPADYSEENIPYTPKQFLKVSLQGYKEGDPTMIMGYPGRTNRFMTHSELVETRDLSNAISIYVRGIRQDILMADMEADPKIMIQYASKYSGSSNGWKKWIGMNQTFEKLGVEQRRAAEEQRFTEWVNKGGKKRISKYGDALSKINKCIADRHDSYYNLLYLSESAGRIELASMGSTAPMMDEYMAGDSAVKAGIAAKQMPALQRFYKDYSFSTDRKVAKAMLKIAKEKIFPEYQPACFKDIDEKFAGDCDAYVDWMFDHSVFSSLESVMAKLGSGDTAFKFTDDPAAVFSRDVKKISAPLMATYRKDQEKFAEGKKAYIAGTLEMRKKESFYPDANFTMRFTYGSVLPYSPKDAVLYNYYTTLDGVMEKEDPDNWEFNVPAKLKELWKAKDYGQYALPNGQMPACFLSNNDITGGNSGSPVMNGRGELIGLAFDGNWESMSSDIIFEPQLQRCICVDVRYVLFIIDKFGGAGYLLDEMDLVK